MLSPDRSKVKSSLTSENASDSSSSQQPMSYLQRINSAKSITDGFSNGRAKTSEITLGSNEFDSNTVHSNGKSTNNSGASFQNRSQSENNLASSGSNSASNLQPNGSPGDQRENNNNFVRRNNSSNKPIQYVKPMIRTANTNAASEKGDGRSNDTGQEENTVVVKVLKKSSSFTGQKSQQESNGDVKNAGRSVGEMSRSKAKDYSASTENLAISNQNG